MLGSEVFNNGAFAAYQKQQKPAKSWQALKRYCVYSNFLIVRCLRIVCPSVAAALKHRLVHCCRDAAEYFIE